MTIQPILFYVFSVLAIMGGVAVIASKNPVRAVLFLVFTFFCMAVEWMLIESEFLAIVLVLVYVGAVMVLFLFVVMMLDIEAPKLRVPFVKYWPIGAAIAGLMLTMLIFLLKKDVALSQLQAPAMSADYSHVKALATLLYTDYLLPFEVAGVILLVAMIAAIGLTFRGPRGVKTQQPALQAQAHKSERLRIIKMEPERGEQP